jgi:hypothetical protein
VVVEKDLGEEVAKAKADAQAQCDAAVAALPDEMPAEAKDHEAKKLVRSWTKRARPSALFEYHPFVEPIVQELAP